MERPTYYSSKQHVRVRFTPLTWSCVLQCLSPESPTTQKIQLDLEVIPDRAGTPCYILPQLNVYDRDGVMDVSGGNTLLAANSYAGGGQVIGHEWYVDGQEISSVWTADTTDSENDYCIEADTSSELNGMLTIRKNLSEGEVVSLRYRGVFNDTRTSSNIVVVSDTMELTCLEAGSEELQMSAAPCIIAWDPLKDQRLLCDYLTAQGITATYTDDGQTYLRTVELAILQGTTALEDIPDGYSLKFFLRGKDTEVTEDDAYVDSISGRTITFDMRYADDTEIEARLIDDDTDLVRCRCSIDLLFQPTAIASVKQKNGCDLCQSQETYENTAVINTAKETVEYPDCYYDINWYLHSVGSDTASVSDTRVLVGTGSALSLAVADIGMDKSTEDGAQFWLTVEAEEKAAGTYTT